MRILVVDDHTLFRDAVGGILDQLADGVTVFGAATATEALAAVRHYQGLDLILLDLALPGMPGIELLRQLRETLFSTPIVVLSASESPESVNDALVAGAAGYIPKTSSSSELLAALRKILDGEIYAPASLLAAADAWSSGAPARPRSIQSARSVLSERQLDVLRGLGAGLSNKGIARQLGLTEGTVKLHVSAVLRALDARNRTDAVRLAVKRGLLHG